MSQPVCVFGERRQFTPGLDVAGIVGHESGPADRDRPRLAPDADEQSVGPQGLWSLILWRRHENFT